MNHRRIQISIAVVLMGLLLIAIAGCKGEAAGPTESSVVASTTTVEQTTCPVMGGPIKKAVATEYNGKKVYFCCAGCEKKFLDAPEKYTVKLPQFKK